jgi:hypothetical protein
MTTDHGTFSSFFNPIQCRACRDEAGWREEMIDGSVPLTKAASYSGAAVVSATDVDVSFSSPTPMPQAAAISGACVCDGGPRLDSLAARRRCGGVDEGGQREG